MLLHQNRRHACVRPGLLALFASLAALVMLALMPLAGVPVARAESEPDFEIQEVSSTVAPGDILRYKIKVENWTDYDLLSADVTLIYHADQLTPIGSRLRSDDDWVSDVSSGRITVSFGEIEDDDSRSATLEFEVNPAVADSTLLNNRAKYEWHSANRSGEGQLEDFDVLVINPNVEPYASVAPEAGPAGTVFQFQANRFEPFENVVTWLNTPTGVKSLELHTQAGNPATVQLSFDSSGLAPGDYSLVLHGMESGREYAVPFTVRPAG